MSTIGRQKSAVFSGFELAQRFVSASWREMDRIRKNRQSRAVTRHLLTYDDRMLDDMGVTRSDVEQALAEGSETNSAVALAEIRQRRLQAERQGLIQRRVR